jgi:hypothetical protein
MEGTIMKELQLTLVALLGLSSAAFAQQGLPGAQAQQSVQYSAVALQGPQAPGRIVHNANDCPPDRPVAAWGADSTLLGYTCATPKANR